MKNDSPYIAQILQNIATIKEFLGTATFEDFQKNQMMQSAVLMQLLQIGEMAKQVSEKARGQIDVPWKKMAGLRDVIVHEYYKVLLPLVWNSVISEFAVIEAPLGAYLKKHPSSG